MKINCSNGFLILIAKKGYTNNDKKALQLIKKLTDWQTCNTIFWWGRIEFNHGNEDDRCVVMSCKNAAEHGNEIVDTPST